MLICVFDLFLSIIPSLSSQVLCGNWGGGGLEIKSCACFCFPSARIKGVCHRAWPKKALTVQKWFVKGPYWPGIYLLATSNLFSCWLCLFWGTLMWRLICFSEMEDLAFFELQKLFWGGKLNRKELLFANTCLLTGFFITGMWLRSFKF